MTRATDYTNASQQRLLRMVGLLAGHEVNGLAPAEIARALGCAASVVTRDLDNLRTAGWAEPTPDGKAVRLSPYIVQIGLRYASGIQTGQQNLNDTLQRFGRT